MGMKSQANTGYVAFLSLVAAIGGILFGYDTAVISGTITGVATQFSLDSMQQGWFVGCALVGSIGGVAVAGMLSDRFGRKLTMLLSAVLFTVSAIGCAVCADFTQLVIYRIVGGVGIGVVSIVSPMYISEVAMARWRGTLVSLYQLAITVGIVAAYLVNNQLLNFAQSEPALHSAAEKIFVAEFWRGMLGMGIIPSLIFLIAVCFIPESPRWLVAKKRVDKASGIFRKLFSAPQEADAQVQATLESCRTSTKSEISELFRPGIFKALLIGVAIAMLGQFMGVNAVLYYGPEIFKDAGLASGDALFYQVLVGMANMLTTVLAMFIIDKVGRKTLIYYGVSGMIISLLWISIYFTFSERLQIPGWILLIGFLGYIFCCAISVCAVIFIFLSEMYPTRVRGIAMSIAGFSLWIGTYLIGQLTPYILEKLGPSGTFILFAFMCVPYLLIVWKLMPETAGKSLEEIETYWNKFN